MGRIPDETIQAIRDRIDLVELVGRYITLRQSGRNHKGLCPFHEEKTPSFNVNADRQMFHCFGCGEGGNAFGFLMRHENLTFPEAARALAAECGIEIPEGEPEEAGLSQSLRAANEHAQEFYRRALAAPEAEPARAYLAERGVGREAIETFGIGFAPDRWDALVRHLGTARVSPEKAVRAGLICERASGGHYDRLRGRVTFPIRDVRGRVVGFGGRAIQPDQQPKYMNSPESPIYRKREVLFGFPQALEAVRRRGRAVVAEGYFDVVALQRAGVAEALATCGTALTSEHARDLRRRTRDLVLVFDGDEAGQRAALSAAEVLLSRGLRVRAALLAAGDDPDTLLRREGADALRQLVDAAPPLLEFAIRRACRDGVSTPWEKSDAVGTVVPLLALIADPVERGEFARRLALAADVRPEDVDAAVRAKLRGSSGGDADEAVAGSPRRAGPEERWVERIAALLLAYPHFTGRLSADEFLDLVPEGPLRVVIAAILEAARAGGEVDPARLADGLDETARARLTALAVDEAHRFEEEVALRSLEDTLQTLRRKRKRRERRDATRRFSQEPGTSPDTRSFLAEKERQQSERREMIGSPPGVPRH